jgi:Protein of unknown function (DUF1565)
MASLSRTRGCAIFALTITAWTVACGHSALDLIPEDPDGGVATGDAGVVPDPVLDAAVDAGCTGPSCPGTYVAGDIGDDTNPGTGVSPVKTIKRAMEIAVQLGAPQSVFVAAGHYPEKVALVEGVSLLGGYACSAQPCTWERNIEANDTAILDTDFEGVLAGTTITRRTRLEGLRIEGKEGSPTAFPGAAAVTLAGGSPTIKRCKIHGPNTTTGVINARRSIGVVILAPSNDPKGAQLVDNEIKGGIAAEQSAGVMLTALPSATDTVAATILKNRIQGGKANAATGILAWSSAPGTLVEDNDIAGGTATDMSGPGSWGIAVEASMTINKNRINTDATTQGICTATAVTDFCGGIVSYSSAAVITNNVIRGANGPRSAAVRLIEGEKVAGNVILNGNTLDAAGVAPQNANLSAAIAFRTNFGTNGVFGTVRNNILLGGTNQYRVGVYEESVVGKTARPAVLENNDFWFPSPSAAHTDVPYRMWNGSGGTEISFGMFAAKLLALAPKDNLNVDPLLGTGFHLQTNSPVIDKGTGTEPATDMDGETRPKGGALDIGADEAL